MMLAIIAAMREERKAHFFERNYSPIVATITALIVCMRFSA